jgi:hypothetical protein
MYHVLSCCLMFFLTAITAMRIFPVAPPSLRPLQTRVSLLVKCPWSDRHYFQPSKSKINIALIAPKRATQHSNTFSSFSLHATSSKELNLAIPTAEDMEDFGAVMASILLSSDGEKTKSEVEPVAVFLDGDLGAGKTKWSTGFVHAATGDFSLPVTSPTYLLSNSYHGALHKIE